MFPPGTRVGPYEVVARIGAGGMGEVYKARDARLGRETIADIALNRFAVAPRPTFPPTSVHLGFSTT